MPDHDDKTVAHMNMVQGVITRLETNCFTLKAMAMTMAAALLAFLGAIEDPNWIYPAAVGLPVVVFWAMDAQYLRLGRCFRRLFNSVRKHECADAFSMDISQFKQQEKSVVRIMFSWSVSLFYLSILLAFILSMMVFLSLQTDLELEGAKPTLPATPELSKQTGSHEMAKKTFISYKYSEAQGLRDEIIGALGDDATFYKGETADSPDLTDESTEAIRKKLTDMMYDTSVTIVVISPNMTDSKWIDWEIEYSVKEITRKNRTSQSNGVVGVIHKVNGGYDWLVTRTKKPDGCCVRSYDTSKLYDIINNNRYRRKGNTYACANCKTYNQLDGSYVSLIDAEEFLADPEKYIENAFEKSEEADDFDLTKQR